MNNFLFPSINNKGNNNSTPLNFKNMYQSPITQKTPLHI